MAGISCRPVASLLLLLCALYLSCRPAHSVSVAEENALQALSAAWNGRLALGWTSANVCDWNGVTCSPDGSQVQQLNLQSENVTGAIPQEIRDLANLQILELAFMPGLGGQLPAQLGLLINLGTLNLQQCAFSGPIPVELGQLKNLKFLALNGNNLNGGIPAQLGALSELYWFDLSDNQLQGPIPVSSTSPINLGMDNLTDVIHMHFNNNSLSGGLPVGILNLPKLLHLLLDSNKLGGVIPPEIGNLASLEILRLQQNAFIGDIPAEISRLSALVELHLNDNQLDGTVPDLSVGGGLSKLTLLDVSNNSFTSQPFPPFLVNFQELVTFVASGSNLVGPIPSSVFALKGLKELILSNNALNGTLRFGSPVSSGLDIVLLDNNLIDAVAQPLPSNSFDDISLVNNPVCANGGGVLPAPWCSAQPGPVLFSRQDCGGTKCDGTKSLNRFCGCRFALAVTIQLTSPPFSYVNNDKVTQFEALLSQQTSTQVVVPIAQSAPNTRIKMSSLFFASDGGDLDLVTARAIVANLSGQVIAIAGFGPYLVFTPPPIEYPPLILSRKSKMSAGAIVGILIAALVVVLLVAGIAWYAFRQKKRADKAEVLSKPFASWPGKGTGDGGGAPQLKGARWFSFSDLKKATGSFVESNEIGVGGYGKVYKGRLESGEIVAVKRAQEGSMQGAAEFKTEIELLSRVHHRNLVGLVGFCYEQGEQMLVYEFMANGTLREHLLGKIGVPLSWSLRLSIALGSARGLAYLHDLANPPIIHRDVKSSNILLDDKMIAKVADFGLSKLAPDGDGKAHVSTQVKGTLGYLDPEYYMTQQLSDKSDVYSFGVVLLEIITAKQPIERGKYIVREVKTALDKGGMAALRPLLDPFVTDYNPQDLKTFLDLALRCVEEAAADRPTMGEVVRDLEALMGQSYPDSGNVTINVNEKYDSGEYAADLPAAR